MTTYALKQDITNVCYLRKNIVLNHVVTCIQIFQGWLLSLKKKENIQKFGLLTP